MSTVLRPFLLALGAYSFLVARFWFVNDDAYIAFRYSRNLAAGDGLCFNPGTVPPVEGFTSFLWVLLGTVFELLPLDIAVGVPVVSALCGAGLLALVMHRLVHRLGVAPPLAAVGGLLMATFPPYALWATGGLETMAFALAMFWAFDRLILAPRPGAWGGLSLLVLSMLRFEGVAWSGGLLFLAALRHRADLRVLVPAVTVFTVTYAGYTGWRWATFGEWMPNSVRAKTGSTWDPAGWSRGTAYLMTHVLTFLTPVLAAAGAVRALVRRRPHAFAVASTAAAFPLFALLSTGDFMPMGRLLVAGIPFQIILTVWLLEGLATRRAVLGTAVLATIALQLLPAWNIHVVPREVRDRYEFRRAWRGHPNLTEYDFWKLGQRDATLAWAVDAKILERYVQSVPEAERPRSVVVSPAGTYGYFTTLKLYDRAGLVTPAVLDRDEPYDISTRSPGHDRVAPLGFFADLEPDLLQTSIVHDTNPTLVQKRCLSQKRALQSVRDADDLDRRYFIDFVDVSTEGAPAVLVLWRRIDGDADAAWAGFDARMDSLTTEVRRAAAAPRDRS
ncbi:MAG: hypothetical protein HKN12_01905 [Gemmatimonadetes bacterium]|nr:hypothetical protein [Gemmatimonadota bacterium]